MKIIAEEKRPIARNERTKGGELVGDKASPE